MADNSPSKGSGCGLFRAIFARRASWSKPTSAASPVSSNIFPKTPTNFPEDPSKPRIIAAPNRPRNPPVNRQNQGRKIPEEQKTARSSRTVSGKPASPSGQQVYVNQGRKVPKESTGISGELDSIISEHQKNRGTRPLLRASSSNVMLFGNLGNLRQGGTGNVNSNNNAVEASSDEKYQSSVMANVVKKQAKASKAPTDGTFCRALSTRMDPETLKIMGNEDYKNGNFAEALALYDAAISLDADKASYRSNRSAALTALGRLLDAVFECREAIRIEPRYYRAHLRLANLYFRLGDAEKALYHYKQAGPEADPDDIAKVKNLQVHLSKCTDVRRRRDWNSLVKVTRLAISAGANAAPQIYSLQAEALLKLKRHQDADEALAKGPKFDDDACIRYFGPVASANLLMVRAQVGMALGRFDDALTSTELASRLDSNNKEANIVMRRVQAVAAARLKGNELFKASRISEASAAYSEGLEDDPYNSLLLCNRAACRSKLGQYDKAVEDCNAALNLRPSYSKARLRRADCNAKMQRWEAALRDYETLLEETPDDEEVKKALSDAQAQLKKQKGM